MGHGKVRIGQAAFSASQVGTLFGCGWSTMLDLYERYKGTAKEKEVTEEARRSMEFGTFFEDSVARWWAEKNGVRIRKCGETAYWSDDMPYFICHPDRLVIGKDLYGQRVALEIKCVAPFAEGWGPEGTEQIPDVYYFQVQSYYACDVPCDLVKVVCMKGNRIYVYDIERDDDVVSEIRRKVRKTKRSFDKGIVPEPEDFQEAVRHFGPSVNKDMDGVGANDEVMGIYDKLIELKYQQDDLKGQEDGLKKQLVTSLGEAPAYLANNGGKVKRIAYWLESTRSSIDTDALAKDHPEIDLDGYTKTTTLRSFRISYPRGGKE